MTIEEKIYWAFAYWDSLHIIPENDGNGEYKVAIRAARGPEIIELELTTWDKAMTELVRASMLSNIRNPEKIVRRFGSDS